MGVTLLELMVVVAIIAIATSAAAPGLRSLVANNEADSLLKEMQIDIGFARSQAATTAQEVSFSPIAGNWSSGWIITQGVNELRVRGSSSTPKADAGTITSTTFSSGNPLKFDAKGRAISTGNFVIKVPDCAGSRLYTLTINQIGQIIVSGAVCP